MSSIDARKGQSKQGLTIKICMSSKYSGYKSSVHNKSIKWVKRMGLALFQRVSLKKNEC